MPFPTQMVFEPHGAIKLDSFVGSDLDVVNSARVSFAKCSETYTESDAKILRFLMRQRHGTPFEHNYFKFHVRAPMIVWWEWVRHRIASYNIESARYVEMRQDFYIPTAARKQTGKPGNYSFVPMADIDSKYLRVILEQHARDCLTRYDMLMKRGIAKEQARLVLPTNIYVEGYFSCNARSLMNFLSLRNDPHAMYEIRKYAEAAEKLFAYAMPDTHAAFIENGRPNV